MLEPTKKLLTDDAVYLGVICGQAVLEEVRAALEARGCVIEEEKRVTTVSDEKEWYTLEELFPDHHGGDVVRGLRYREGMTQKQVAESIGISVNNLSHIENGRRPIGKDVAKRLAKALNTDWRLFLR
ncbi:helix-turn-helix transcriptional regulator [Desulfovibrio sp. OttesenSCG-928-A18]|nr:helix-turn-helix transcriptional regulator [Desulfovibrio sp. OttesenSCG-928-A18]